jgi:hypothetical protein
MRALVDRRYTYLLIYSLIFSESFRDGETFPSLVKSLGESPRRLVPDRNRTCRNRNRNSAARRSLGITFPLPYGPRHRSVLYVHVE